MAYLRESEVYTAARRAVRARRFEAVAESILNEQTDPRQRHYDIFLSHSVKDAEIVLGAKQILEELGHSVYVDWIADRQLDRSKVNRKTANVLRQRMKSCDSLFYLHSSNSKDSKWMPWELGFFDGHNGNVAILPVLDDDEQEFKGQEYLSLYPYVDIAGTNKKPNQKAVWVNHSAKQYLGLKDWTNGSRTWETI